MIILHFAINLSLTVNLFEDVVAASDSSFIHVGLSLGLYLCFTVNYSVSLSTRFLLSSFCSVS